jgi:hypothetical protein
VGVAAANQHKIFEEGPCLHPDPVYPIDRPSGTSQKNIVYQCIILISFSYFGATHGRYFRPLDFHRCPR